MGRSLSVVTIHLNQEQRAIIAGRLANVASCPGLFGSELRDLQQQRTDEIWLDSLGVLADRYPDLVDCLREAEVVR